MNRRMRELVLLAVSISAVIAVFSLFGLAQEENSGSMYGASPVATSPDISYKAELEARVSALETQVAEISVSLTPTVESFAQSESVATHTIAIELLLIGTDNWTIKSGSCTGEGGYDDLRIGASITVMDGDGSIIGTGWIESATRIGTFCQFVGTVADVPEVDFYQFKVSHRGAPSYSLSEMKANDWTVSLSIGD